MGNGCEVISVSVASFGEKAVSGSRVLVAEKSQCFGDSLGEKDVDPNL